MPRAATTARGMIAMASSGHPNHLSPEILTPLLAEYAQRTEHNHRSNQQNGCNFHPGRVAGLGRILLCIGLTAVVLTVCRILERFQRGLGGLQLGIVVHLRLLRVGQRIVGRPGIGNRLRAVQRHRPDGINELFDMIHRVGIRPEFGEPRFRSQQDVIVAYQPLLILCQRIIGHAGIDDGRLPLQRHLTDGVNKLFHSGRRDGIPLKGAEVGPGLSSLFLLCPSPVLSGKVCFRHRSARRALPTGTTPLCPPAAGAARDTGQSARKTAPVLCLGRFCRMRSFCLCSTNGKGAYTGCSKPGFYSPCWVR